MSLGTTYTETGENKQEQMKWPACVRTAGVWTHFLFLKPVCEDHSNPVYYPPRAMEFLTLFPSGWWFGKPLYISVLNIIFHFYRYVFKIYVLGEKSMAI